MAVFGQVLPRKFALPGIGPVHAIRRQFRAPGVFAVAAIAARGELPLRFGRQGLAGPARVGLDIGVGDVHDRVVVAAFQRAVRTLRMPPVGTGDELPPLVMVAQVDAVRRRHEHHRGRTQHLRQRARVLRRIRWDLAERHVAGGFDEAPELRVGDRCDVHPETIDMDPVRRRFLRVVMVRAHAVGTARNPDHARIRGLHRRYRDFDAGIHGVPPAGWMVFQSRFMSTTTQCFACASMSALSRRPTWESRS